MPARDLDVINELGLHARAAAKVVTLAQSFSSDIRFTLDGNTVDATSIMGLLILAAAQGRTIAASATGEDADAALSALYELFANRFGEES